MKKKQSYMDTNNVLSEGLLTKLLNLFSGGSVSGMTSKDWALLRSGPFRKATRAFNKSLQSHDRELQRIIKKYDLQGLDHILNRDSGGG